MYVSDNKGKRPSINNCKQISEVPYGGIRCDNLQGSLDKFWQCHTYVINTGNMRLEALMVDFADCHCLKVS